MPLGWRRTSSDVRALLTAVPRGGVAVDCGANVGEVATALARRCRKVVAFEPNPVAFDVLEQRLGRARNVELVRAAVGARAGRRRLFLHLDHESDPIGASVGSSLHASKGNVSTDSWVEVDVVDLDAYLAQLDERVDLLKLDVEGAEIEILERMLDSGRLRTIGRVVVEMHDDVIPELEARGMVLRSALQGPLYANVSLAWR